MGKLFFIREFVSSSSERKDEMSNNIEKVRMLEFKECGDEKGNLVVIEGERDIPFTIKRAFYIYGSTPDVIRGRHANKRTKFVLINVAGKSKVKIKDGKGNEIVYCLNRAKTGLYIPEMVWKEMYDFSEDSVLLCLASEYYDDEEYIREYEDYQEYIK